MYIQFHNSGVVHFLLSLHFMHILSTAQTSDHTTTACLSTFWTNSPSIPTISFNEGTPKIRVILLSGMWDSRYYYNPVFACGFFCNGNCDSYLFAIFIVGGGDAYNENVSGGNEPLVGYEPQVVWTANRNWPVKLNSTLHFTSDGDLILKDVDGTVAWATNTRGKSVVGLKLTDLGNLLLFDENNATVWQSFDHPTDCLVPGQKLIAGQKLVPSVSATNWTQLSLFSLTVTDQGMLALIESNPPQVYSYTFFKEKGSKEPTYVTLRNGSFACFVDSSDPAAPDLSIPIPLASYMQYARFCPDGHLRLYDWGDEVADLLAVDECGYPTVCGDYGICSNGQCSCPSTPDINGMYFKQRNYKQPQLGCSEITPLSCEASQYHSFMELSGTTYFTLVRDLENVDLQSCKDACLKNCSCKAAIFQNYPNISKSICYLPNQVFSLINIYQGQDFNGDTDSSIVYLKVQNVPAAHQKKINVLAVILGSSIGSFFVLLISIGVLVLLSRKKAEDDDEDEEDNIEQLPGMLARFSLEDLKVMTENFSKVLGQGGFGSVFEGTRTDGTKIAVKRLNGLVQVKRSFLAEVESIGSIHHVNLVRLLGFCAEKSHRILVYEFMPNGSMDKWIFCESNQSFLNWKQKKKIIVDIAKGLTYLHEECNQKIVHMDIKPQNILLDHNYNAKICDFGLSKLIDRDQSKVVTTMRGTPGYLAPEWLSSEITEKVDIYSFGVVLLEILCGRKNIDSSQPEELMHLLKVFEKKKAENRLFDLVENCSKNMESDKEEMLNMMKIASWCLRKDYAARPSMSMVVKVLEGDCEVQDNPSYSLSNLPLSKTSSDSTPLLPLVLSGPRRFILL